MSDTLHRPIPMERIIQVASKFLGVSKWDMRSPRRQQNIVRARWIAMYLCREMTCASLPMIGRAFGDRDHSTVIHALRESQKRRERDADFDLDIGDIQDFLEADANG